MLVIPRESSFIKGNMTGVQKTMTGRIPEPPGFDTFRVADKDTLFSVLFERFVFDMNVGKAPENSEMRNVWFHLVPSSRGSSFRT